MAEKAAELFKKGMADWILPSGKYSVVNGKFSGVLEKSNVYNKEYGTEWEFLRDVLIKNGVPDQKILKEDQATFTYEKDERLTMTFPAIVITSINARALP